MQLDCTPLIDQLASQIGTLPDDTAIVGIHSGGAWVAERLHRALGGKHLYGTLAVTLHRDDFKRIGLHPQRKSTDIPFEVEGRHILLVDDVIQSGRTLRAALNELFDFGRPASVKHACLVDRGGRELPFATNWAAMTMNLAADQELTLGESNGTLLFTLQPKS